MCVEPMARLFDGVKTHHSENRQQFFCEFP